MKILNPFINMEVACFLTLNILSKIMECLQRQKFKNQDGTLELMSSTRQSLTSKSSTAFTVETSTMDILTSQLVNWTTLLLAWALCLWEGISQWTSSTQTWISTSTILASNQEFGVPIPTTLTRACLSTEKKERPSINVWRTSSSESNTSMEVKLQRRRTGMIPDAEGGTEMPTDKIPQPGRTFILIVTEPLASPTAFLSGALIKSHFMGLIASTRFRVELTSRLWSLSSTK